MDQAEWHESVLSTRSLSYVSSPGHGSQHSSITYIGAPRRRSTQISDFTEDGDLEMADTDVQGEGEKSRGEVSELPESVAHSLLYCLPREIRDRIYSLCLTATDGTPVEWPRGQSGDANLQPQLLRTCRIIHDEAAPLLYTLNIMTFHHPSDANMFVHAFASSAAYGRQISNLSLHIKAQEMRLWMPYLTSAVDSRSLRADFPNLKELGVRFRSNKWLHQNTAESNLRTWSDDSRLEEVISGLRHAFQSNKFPVRKHITEADFQHYMARNPNALQEEGDSVQFRRRLLELQKANAARSTPRLDAPTIRVCCACRVHSIHFNALTTPAIIPPYTNGEGLPQAPIPVREGEPFRGFTAIDLQSSVKEIHNPDLGSANVARTAYAEKNGILLALEVHCLDPKKDGAERAA